MAETRDSRNPAEDTMPLPPAPTTRLDMRRRMYRSFPAFGVGAPVGDFVRDEDFDDSYEGLLALTSRMGQVRPKGGTPESVLSKLSVGVYSEFKKAKERVYVVPNGKGKEKEEEKERCIICLDDVRACSCVEFFLWLIFFEQYEDVHQIMKISECAHYGHKDCLEVIFCSCRNDSGFADMYNLAMAQTGNHMSCLST